MISINIKLTPEEAELLSSLASDQLFRREFIDPKIPGYRANPGAVRLGKQLVERLQTAVEQAKGPRVSRRNGWPSVKNSEASASADSEVR